MKKLERAKGFVLGVVITLIVTTTIVPAFAQAIDVLFNNINIEMNGKVVANAGESYTLDNGDTVPYSILYRGTTYIPLRKIGELYGMDVSWNGETNTAIVNGNVYQPPTTLKMYEEFPTVPDFGAFANATLYYKGSVDGFTSYQYKYFPTFNPYILFEYCSTLFAHGFEYYYSFIDESGNGVSVLNQGDILLYFGMTSDFFTVLIVTP